MRKRHEHPHGPSESATQARSRRFETDGFGYFAIQATNPQTIGYPLADSPAGLAAWIYEKYHAWTDHGGDPEQALTRDQMLDNITLYWLTNTAASSARMYVENQDLGTAKHAGIIEMPVGCSMFRDKSFLRRATGEQDVSQSLLLE